MYSTRNTNYKVPGKLRISPEIMSGRGYTTVKVDGGGAWGRLPKVWTHLL